MPLVKCPDCGRDVSDRAEACPGCGCPGRYFPAAPKPALHVGDTLQLGSWGGEAISWRVLDVEGARALLLADRAVDGAPYNEELAGVTWSACTLRRWLNGPFLQGAFSAAERARIAEAQVANDDNPVYGTPGGPDTRDRVFCLSIGEVRRYLADDGARVCRPTRHARSNGAWKDGSRPCRWWLRSPGRNSDDAAIVGSDGYVFGSGVHVLDGDVGVRPALWLNL